MSNIYAIGMQKANKKTILNFLHVFSNAYR